MKKHSIFETRCQSAAARFKIRLALLLVGFSVAAALPGLAQNATLTTMSGFKLFVGGGTYGCAYTNQQIKVSLSGDFSTVPNPVTLAVMSGGPAGASFSFSTNGFTNGQTLLMSVAVNNVTPGTYPLTISATTNGGMAFGNTLTLPLIVGTTWSSTNTVDPSANVNWSTATNWSAGAPVAGSDVLLSDMCALTNSYAVTNYMDVSETLNSFAIIRNNSSSTNYLTLAPNTTLSVLGTNGFSVNVDAYPANSKAMQVNIAGAGATLLVSNAAANVAINGDSTGNSGTALNMTNLDNFYSYVSRFGVSDVNMAVQGGVGAQFVTFPMAKTNFIYAGYVGDYTALNYLAGAISMTCQNDSYNNGSAATYNLGIYNVFKADSMVLGQSRVGGANVLQFNPVFTNKAQLASSPYLSVCNTNGSRMSLLTVVADCGTNTIASNSKFNLTLVNGYVNMLVDTMWIARNRLICTNLATSLNSMESGTFSFNNGIVDVNTLRAGYQAYTNNQYCQGTVTVGGQPTNTALLRVNNELSLGFTSGDTISGVAARQVYGKLNINTNGTVAANQITVGQQSTNNAITIAKGGTLIVSNTIASGTAGLTTLSLDGAQLTLSVTAGITNVFVTNLTLVSASKINIAALTGFTSYPATNVIISYQTAASHVGLGVGTLPAGFNNVTLNDNTANNTIELIVSTNAPKNLVWNGPGAVWDHSSYNWFDTNAQATAHFTDGDKVTFNDASGVPTSITINESVAPSQSGVGIYFTNSVNKFTFTTNASVNSGIVGGPVLVKYGTADLEVDGYANVSAQINQGRLIGSGVLGTLTTVTNTFAGWSGEVLSSATIGGAATNSGVFDSGLTLAVGGKMTNSGTIHGVLDVNNAAVLNNSGSMDSLGVSTVEAGGTLINSGSLVGNTINVSGTFKDMGVNPIKVVANLAINQGATFIPGGDTIGTTTITPTSTSDPTTAGTMKFAATSTNIFKVDPGAVGQNCTMVLSDLPLIGPSQATVQTNGGVLVITNVGTTKFAAGQTFQLFAPEYGGSSFAASLFSLNTTNSYPVMQPDHPGFGLVWDLSNVIFGGTIGIATSTLPQTPTPLVFTASGNVLTFSWPSSYTGWQLQQQTNTLNVGLTSTNWTVVSGSVGTNSISITNGTTIPAAFFRLSYPYP
jgi:hypothetical protein